MDGWMDGWVGGWMEGQVDGWMDEHQINGSVGVQGRWMVR